MDFSADLAKQRRKNSWGGFEVSKNDFCVYFFFWCIAFFVPIYCLHAVPRHTRHFSVDEELHPRSRLREYVDSKRRLVAKELCYAKPTRSSWPLKQGRMGDLSLLKEDLEQKITTWQREIDLKLMKSIWGAHVRTP